MTQTTVTWGKRWHPGWADPPSWCPSWLAPPGSAGVSGICSGTAPLGPRGQGTPPPVCYPWFWVPVPLIKCSSRPNFPVTSVRFTDDDIPSMCFERKSLLFFLLLLFFFFFSFFFFFLLFLPLLLWVLGSNLLYAQDCSVTYHFWFRFFWVQIRYLTLQRSNPSPTKLPSASPDARSCVRFVPPTMGLAA